MTPILLALACAASGCHGKPEMAVVWGVLAFFALVAGSDPGRSAVRWVLFACALLGFAVGAACTPAHAAGGALP